MNTHKENESPFSSFTKFWSGVFDFDLRAMGIRAILVALVRLARTSDGAKKRGLEATLSSYDGLTTIHTNAMAGDRWAYAELLALATVSTAMLNDATEKHPKTASEFATVSITWPILYSCVSSGKSNSPQVRLEKIGFGSCASQDSKLRSLTNNLGVLALLLHAFNLLGRVHRGALDGNFEVNPDNQQAAGAWNASAKPILDGSAGKLSDLPFSEVNNIKAQRSCRVTTNGKQVEVSGDVRQKVKEWFFRWHPLVRRWTSLGRNKN